LTRLDERMVTIAWGGDSPESLEGVFMRGGEEDAYRGAVVAPPHPLYGGSLESPVVCEIAYACSQAGVASLRFNWRGVGASAGAPSGEAADADADFAAALSQMRETVSGPVVACGYSFGAAAAARAAALHPAIDRLLLVAPPVSMLPPTELETYGGRLLVVGGSDDELAPLGPYAEVLSEHPKAQVETVPGADHFFAVGLARVGRVCAEWLGARREQG